MSSFVSLQATKPKTPTEKELEKEIVQKLNKVNVQEFNIQMLMKHLSRWLKFLVFPHFCNRYALLHP